ncbi:SIS domain-containing protein [Buchananella hordeovulneris]|uniref:Sugar isomerase n=1 Tax=Buchananella hordeovulneris TaxID=52770 RepID=A0A1Q5PTP7_9ACTO|nr:SIS domain-containing protein [Buchananella hordeovulneris]MDO5081535.1 SIS domain-containing protein [Buchananella hordeovulneris]OKL50934.1 sugar isomerase [Buchananella hordeovulneris]RRD44140.1 SIS domain-containing protein [Buchananella hordeovulneris]RRD51724.1 SIS domain-containing protein [Buchananella hordeovulneris]
MSKTVDEIITQPALWRRAAELAEAITGMPADGERVAVIGCGTSWFMAQSYCALRESLGKGESDAFTATEFPLTRSYDRVVLLSRSGTTTEIIDVAKELQARGVPNVLITAVANGPATPFVDAEIVLDFADEESVVQTRFATTAFALMRATLGQSLEQAATDCEKALAEDICEQCVNAPQITFLGTGWTIGLANEAALKCREASQSWTESYPAMEYRHGPISIAEPGRIVWVFGPVPPGLDKQIADTGARLVTSALDPLAHLVLAQRVSVARAEARGLNPDTPRHLTRSIILADDEH